MEHIPTEFNRFQAQQSYTDLNQLNNIRQLGREDQSLALRQVAKQFESMFLNLMLKNMRAANEVFAKDNPLNSSEMGFHRDMLDHQLSLDLSKSNRFGLAEAFYRQMKNSYINDKYVAGENIDIQQLNANDRISNNPYKESIDSILQRKEDTSVLEKITSPSEFMEVLTPYAEKVAQQLGVDPRVLVAQAALETGWGEYAIRDSHGQHSFNLFNIKADSRWDGHSVKVPTIEYRDGVAQREMASFRRYDNLEQGFKDYYEFLQQPRYQKALNVASNNQDFVQELQNAGYATDPKYAEKINRILNDL